MGMSGGGGKQAQLPAGGYFPNSPQLEEQISQPWDMAAMFGFPTLGPKRQGAGGGSIFDLSSNAPGMARQGGTAWEDEQARLARNKKNIYARAMDSGGRTFWEDFAAGRTSGKR